MFIPIFATYEKYHHGMWETFVLFLINIGFFFFFLINVGRVIDGNSGEKAGLSCLLVDSGPYI